MADWQDMGDGYVRNPAGLEVPREMVPPTDRIMPPLGAAPAAAPLAPAGAPAPAAPGAPQAPLTAASVLAKLDQPAIAAARGQSQLPIAQQTTTTQSAVPMSTLKPVMDRGMARAETQGNAAMNLGETRAQTIEKQADAQTYAAQGQQAVSLEEQETARQRAEIARMNQIAVAAQEDPSIDPDRYVRNMSTGQSVATVILAALEGGFRGMSGDTSGKNSVISILDRRIDQDIMAQKEQIASGRIRRGNMISYFQQQGMTEEAAEKAAKAMAYTQAEKLTQAEIARQGAGNARAEGAALAEQIKAAREQANDDLVLTLGTPRSTTTTVRAHPAGGGEMTNVQRAAEMKAGRDIEQMGASGLTQEEFDKQAKDYSEKSRLNDDLVQRAKDVVSALGGSIQETRDKSGQVTGYEIVGDLDVEHVGPKATRYEAAISNLQRADVMGMAREPSASLQDEFAAATEMPFLDKSKKVKLQNILDIALRERKNLGAGYNPAARSSVESGKAAVGVPGNWK